MPDSFDCTPSGNRHGVAGEVYDRVAREIRTPWASFVGKLGCQFKHPLDWWLEAPATRNPVFSDLYHEVVCLLCLRHLATENQTPDKIIVEHAAMAESVRTELKRLRIHSEVLEPHFSVSLKRKLRQMLSPWRSIARLLAEWMLVRNSGRRSGSADVPEPVLIDTFAIPGHVEQDRYYPGLLDNAGSYRDSVVFVPQFFNLNMRGMRSATLKLREFGARYLLKEDVIGISDLCWTFGHLWRLPRKLLQPATFEELELSTLIIADLKKRRATRCAMRGLLNYRFARQLGQLGIRPARVIDWFENHPMDRGWHAGFNQWFPDTTRIGYLGFFPAGQSYRPTAAEADAGLLPPRLLVIGEGFFTDVREFFADAEIGIAAAFRYPAIGGQPASASKTNTVVVAMPYYRQMCEQVMDVVNILLEQLPELRIRIKAHPAQPLGGIRGAEEALAAGAIEDATPLTRQLKSAALMITGAQASTVLESAALAVPAIIVAPAGEAAELAVPSALPESLYAINHTSDDAVSQVRDFLNADASNLEQRKHDASRFTARCFTPVNPQTVARFLAA